MHEIATDVHLQHIAWLAVILALLSDMSFKAANSEMSTTLFDATVTVGDEGALQHLMGVVVVEMVDDAVAELCGKHLPLLWIGNDEAGGRARGICSKP